MNPRRYTAITCLASIVIAAFGVLHAEEEEGEIPFPGQRETLRFFEKELPDALKALELIKAEEDEEAYEEVLEEFQGNLHEYREIREADGEEAATLFLKLFSLEIRTDLLLHEYHEVAETKEEREAIRKKLGELLREQLEHDRRSIRMELKLLERERAELAEELEELEAMGEAEIEGELEELLDDDRDED